MFCVMGKYNVELMKRLETCFVELIREVYRKDDLCINIT